MQPSPQPRPRRFSPRVLSLPLLPLLIFSHRLGAEEPALPAFGAPAPTSIAELGERLFLDPRLSSTGTISCASCHDPARSFTDGVMHSVGEQGAPVGRNAPTIHGLSEVERFIDPLAFPNFLGNLRNPIHFNDSAGMGSDEETEAEIEAEIEARRSAEPLSNRRAAVTGRERVNFGQRRSLEVAISLAERSLSPLGNPLEMGGDIEGTIALFRERSGAGPLFDALFAGEGGVTRERVGLALAAFIRGIGSPPTAPFARFLAGEPGALDSEARRGLELFRGRAGCASCHEGNDLRDGRVHVVSPPGAPPRRAPTERAGETGAAAQTGIETPDPVLVNGFRGGAGAGYGGLPPNLTATPTLWDVAQTAPYFGDGTVETLEAALEVHVRELIAVGALAREEPPVDALQQSRGGEALRGLVEVVPESMRPAESDPTRWPLPGELSETERRELVAFLRSLSPQETVVPDAPDSERVEATAIDGEAHAADVARGR
ncbi:MAG: cytochrome-c peroxidase [Planctomycetota bacterium]